ncbi:hypothetical protein BCR42DRAFT_58966 [Absidia repens]|uniref:C2H2-type domain-containing protein n=1 Tax=Absidia repens TaxID=90262 RepID=A0A1X2ICF2_9FUNG|nr:hypothetical protein BCR42DRAFT_58966 [Absidia repens]
MDDQETHKDTSQHLSGSSTPSSYSLPQLQRPRNNLHPYQQGTTPPSRTLPLTVISSELSKQVQTLPGTSYHFQQYQQQSTQTRSSSDFPLLSTPSLDTETVQTAQGYSPPKMDNNHKSYYNEQFTDKKNFQGDIRSDHRLYTSDNHARSGHHQTSENRYYTCNYPGCGKEFKQQGNLKTHKRKHTGDRPYQCSFKDCRKAFAQMGNLKTHEKIHWPVKPYLCDYPNCNRGYTQRGNLKTHLIKVHHVSQS